MSMTSRDRVRAALNFREPDRVPIDLGGCNCTGICVDAYVELVRHLGLDVGPPKSTNRSRCWLGSMSRCAGGCTAM